MFMGKPTSRIPTGSFYLREGRTVKGDEGIIYLRYFVCGKYIEHSTDIKIATDEWNKKTRQVTPANKDWKRINAKLQSIKAGFDGKIEAYKRPLTVRVMTDILAGRELENEISKEKDFIEFALEHNNMRYELDQISYSTYDNNRLYILGFQRYLREKENKDVLPLCDLNIDIFNRYINYRLVEKKNTKEGINKMLAPMFFAVRYAADNELIPTKTAAIICANYLEVKDRKYKSKVDEKQIRYLTPEQMRALVNVRNELPHQRTREILDIFLFAFHACGMRVSDIITLEWEHIDWERKEIVKNYFKTKTAGNIPLTDPAIEILLRWKKYKRNKRFVFDLLPEKFNLKDPKALKNARLSKNRTLQQSLKSVGNKIGLKFNMTMHVARHTFAVMSIKKGVSIHMVSRLMGHSSVLVTEKVYAEFLPSEINKIVREELSFSFG